MRQVRAAAASESRPAAIAAAAAAAKAAFEAAALAAALSTLAAALAFHALPDTRPQRRARLVARAAAAAAARATLAALATALTARARVGFGRPGHHHGQRSGLLGTKPNRVTAAAALAGRAACPRSAYRAPAAEATRRARERR